MPSVMIGLSFPGKTGGPTRDNMYEQQDYNQAKQIIELGYLQDLNKKTLLPTEENIQDVAQKYYDLRIRTFDPATGSHL